MLKIQMKKTMALLLAALLVFVMAAFAGCAEKPADAQNPSSSQAEAQTVSVTVEIVHDGGNKTLNLETEKKYLADALVEAGVIEYSADGFYTTVNGITADYSADGAWWCVTKGGEMTMVGMNELELADGDKYEITYTK